MHESLIYDNITTSHQYLDRKQAISLINEYGRTRTPFFFLVSYDMEKTIMIRNPLIFPQGDIQFTFPNHSNHIQPDIFSNSPTLNFDPPSRKIYAHQYLEVEHELHKGNIYLLNLTRSVPVNCQASLQKIYHQAQAKYKVWYPGHFVVFSPETFIRIQKGKIYTHPMKGTIRADVPMSRETLQNDPKEQAEHASIVDLLRNDIGQVARSVKVIRYRYFEKVKAGNHELWQTSTEIEGLLPDDFPGSLGDIIFTLLPAGSITGVPKKNAVSIIDQVEDHDRGFYTGVCGYFDGINLDSGVMIRFIEQTPEGLVYKSGGGIHQMSDMDKEYKELIEKIYVPVH